MNFKYVFKPTPNPNALKLIINHDVKISGKATFTQIKQTENIPLAKVLLNLPLIQQIHFFSQYYHYYKNRTRSMDR